jgi:hypothetical protein
MRHDGGTSDAPATDTLRTTLYLNMPVLNIAPEYGWVGYGNFLGSSFGAGNKTQNLKQEKKIKYNNIISVRKLN